jgi:hypothetical protein
MFRIALVFLSLALAVASAKSYTVKVLQPAVFAGAELQPGEYKVEVNGDKVALKNGAKLIETSVSVQNRDSKNRSTTLRLEAENGRMHIREIRLGGTNTSLVIN